MKLTVTINGKTFEVEVEAAEPEAPNHNYRHEGTPTVRIPAVPPTALAQPKAEGPVNEAKVCRSPVSGIVVKVIAEVGQALQAGDVLVILEAMKMETNITAPCAGKVANIKVAQGDSVQSGQIVLEVE